MRVLTLAQELARRGHDMRLHTAPISVAWLDEYVSTTGIPCVPSAPDVLDAPMMLEDPPDWVVVDSYRIPAAQVSALRAGTRVLAVVDGDYRGIDADLYLDSNLGAEDAPAPEGTDDRSLRGARFALVRDDILSGRRDDPWRINGEPAHVLSLMGGSDPTGASLRVARALRSQAGAHRLTMIAPGEQHAALRAILGNDATVLAPTPDLPALLASADVIVTAAGTSAWDVCTLGVPAVLVAVVDNQQASLAAANTAGVALTIDAVGSPERIDDELGALVGILTSDEAARHSVSDAARRLFDGGGKARIVDRMELP
jgi:spore coat polysaccharide biosynthesis predicted glycosyltransferase SpsG